MATEYLIAWLRALAKVYEEQKQALTDLDSPIGDADHGTNMARGFGQVAEKTAGYADLPVDKLLNDVGMTLIKTVGGSSGPLYGMFFIEAGKSAAGKTELTTDLAVAMFESGLNGILRMGKAAPGDKTMVDALAPAVNALKESAAAGDPLPDALAKAEAAAEGGMLATTPMQARKGRASYLGERSIGHQDPGATSAYYLVKAARETWQADS